ncbi:MAG: hypothetical protein ACLGI6_07285 [Gammaproteobacteria bacterium]
MTTQIVTAALPFAGHRPGRDMGHVVGMAAFLALFPGFFFYHTLLGLGRIGAVLGGFFAPVALLAAPGLLFVYAYRLRHGTRQLTGSDVYFILYLAYFLCIVFVNAVAGSNMQIVGNHLLCILFMVDLFLIFKFTDFADPTFRKLGWISLLAMSTIVFAYSVDGSFYLAPLGTAKNPESVATYQGFSRSYLLTFAVVVAFTRARWLRVLLYCLAAPTLFVNTARSEFVAMLVMAPIIELYFAKRKLLVAAVCVLGFTLVYANLDQLLALLPSNRILELLDLSQSTSANKRHHLTVYALQTIEHYPILGDYASYQPGLYSHNVLSAWVDTGLFGFLFVLGILIIPSAGLFIEGFFHRNKSGQFIVGFALACITALLLVTSHYFTDMFIGAVLGAFAKYRYGKQHGYRGAPDLRPSALGYADLRQAMPPAGAARV